MKEILNNPAVKELVKVLKIAKTQIRDNKEIDFLSRSNWLSLVDDLPVQKDTFSILFKHFADGEENSKSFAIRLIETAG